MKTTTIKTLLAVTLLSVVLPAMRMQAGTKTWTGLGSGSDTNWATAGNWDLGFPVNGDALVFTGTTKLGSTNGLAGLLLDSITYNTGGFLVVGQALTLTNGINDNAGFTTNNLNLTLGKTQSINNQPFGATNVFGGTLNTAGFGLSFGGSGNIIMNGVISGAGALTNNLGGFLRLGGNGNTFSGGLVLNSGTLQVSRNNALSGGNVFLASGAVFDMSAQSPATMTGLFDIAGAGGTVDNTTGTATYTLTVGGSTSNAVFSGTIQNTTGNIALIKNGTNTQTFNGPLNYGGATLINQGVVVLGVNSGGQILNTPSIGLAAGAQLDASANASGFMTFSSPKFQTLTAGRGSAFTNDIIGPVTIQGALNIFNPGNPGTLTLSSNLTLVGGVLNYDLANSTTAGAGVNDLIAINGVLDISGGVTVQINPIVGTLANGTYTLISGATSIVGGTNNIIANPPRGLSIAFDTTTSPSSLLMIGSGTAVPASLIWAGTNASNPNVWDVNATANFVNGVNPDTFFALDSVVFNDTGAGAVTINEAVGPASTTFSNTTVGYTFTGVGAIAGAGGLTKSGTGSLTFRNGSGNTYTGPTTINGGVVLADFNNANTPVAQILYSGQSTNLLVMNGGNFSISSRANTVVNQSFAGLFANSGSATNAQTARQSSGNLTIFLGPITRNQGTTLDFQPQTGNPVASTGIFTSNTNINGIQGGYLTENNATAWSTVNGTTRVVGGLTQAQTAGYNHLQTETNAAAFTIATNNVDVSSLNRTPAANATVNSLRFSTFAASQALTLSGVNVVTSGGVLVTTTGTGSSITGGTLEGSANGELIVHQHNTGAAGFVIGSVIADNTGATALTKAGLGTLTLTGNDTYSGTTYINVGSLQLGNGGTSGSISNSTLINNRGTLIVNRSDTLTYTGLITGSGGVTVNGGGLTVTANNTFSGPISINTGTTLQVGAGGASGSISNAASISDKGNLVFNVSGTRGYSGVISQAGNVAVQGGGTVILGGANTYQGNTTISQGTLALAPAGSISSSAAIAISSGATLDVSSVPGFALGGSQALSGGGTVIGNVATVSGSQINPAGNGTIGTLSFNNNLNLNGGVFNFDLTVGSGDLINVAGNLSLNGGTIQLNITGGPLANGTYKVIGYTGSLSGSVGSLSLAGFAQPGQLASLSSATAHEIDLVISTGVGADLTWLGDGSANIWNLAGTANFTNSAGTPSIFNNNDNVNFTDAGSANSTVSISGALAPAKVTVNSTTDYILGGTGKITGGATLVKSNSDNLTILTLSDYTGPTTIAGGTLTLGNGTIPGTIGNGNVTNNAALVFNEPDDRTLGASISGSGSVTQKGVGVVSLTGNNTYTGGTTIASGTLQIGVGTSSGSISGPVTNNGVLLFNKAKTTTLSGGVTGGGALVSAGAGTLVLSGNNTYTGDTIVTNGTLQAGGTQVMANGAGSGNLVLNGGTTAGIFDLHGFDETINGLNGTAGAQNGTVINSTVGITNLFVVGSGDASATFSGAIKDNNGSGGKLVLVKTGTGTQTLSPVGDNAYTGGTVISNGVLALTTGTSGANINNPNINVTGVGSGLVTFYGGTLQLAGFNGSTTPTYPTFPNNLFVPTNQTGTLQVPSRIAAPGVSGTLTGGGTMNLVVYYVRGDFRGNWSAFTGVINVSAKGAADDFRINSSFGWPNATMNVGAGVFMYQQLGGTPTHEIGALASVPGGNLVAASGGGTSPGTAANWRVGRLNTSFEFGGDIRDANSIIKVGTGTWTLSGTNTYTRNTTVSNGVLLLSGTSSLSPATPVITVNVGAILDASTLGYLTNQLDENNVVTNSFVITNSLITLNPATSQTLAGAGTVRGSVDAAAGTTITAGDASAPTGTLTITNKLTLEGPTLNFTLNRGNSQTASKLVALGGITFNSGGTLNVTNAGAGLHAGDTFHLFNGAAGPFDVVNLPATDANGGTYTWINRLSVDGTIIVDTAVLPVNQTPTNIVSSVTGNTLDLSWPTDHIGWRLQVQTNAPGAGLGTNWVDFAGSTSTNRVIMTISPSNGSVFYRLIYP